jgi:type IV conjugative transfer system coupling protein TraD
MLNNFIGGGQIFLHKITMFTQVAVRSMNMALIVAVIISGLYTYPRFNNVDTKAAMTYQKAVIALGIKDLVRSARAIIKPNEPTSVTRIDAYTKNGIFMENVDARKVVNSNVFVKPYTEVKALLISFISILAIIFSLCFTLIFAIWSRYGADSKAKKHLSGSVIKTAREVMLYLKSSNKDSDFTIGQMPLVKDAETRHILVTGMTGSGKTNLINTLLPQVRHKKQPALVIDQTGEMISKYYNSGRGDIIFNPFDARSHSWDFWTDVTSHNSPLVGDIDPKLEKFAKVLFKFGVKENSSSDPFWNNSAETIFCACVESLLKSSNRSLKSLKELISYSSVDQLTKKLSGTRAERYLLKSNQNTAASILSVMSTSSKPLLLLNERQNEIQEQKKFSLEQYFKEVNQGSESWLFFSTPPNQREVVAPLLGCLLELAISELINIGINEKRRMWFIIDEIAALGRLNSLNTLMNESRKYGGCVLAATQSANQLFNNFGHYAGNTIFGQFATKFMFRNDEPSMAKLVSDIFGHTEYVTQQKNTSYGANEIRDGISYTEQERRKLLVTANDLATLENLECFVGLPEPEVRIARLKLAPVKISLEDNPGFMPIKNDCVIRPNENADEDSTKDRLSSAKLEQPTTRQDENEENRNKNRNEYAEPEYQTKDVEDKDENNKSKDNSDSLDDAVLIDELDEIEKSELKDRMFMGI